MTQKPSRRSRASESGTRVRDLRQRILSRSFPSGSRVDLDAVGHAVGVSRMPVREAVRQLSVERLTVRPRRR
jgi:DNA-binding GntR family transcriptional regulator